MCVEQWHMESNNCYLIKNWIAYLWPIQRAQEIPTITESFFQRFNKKRASETQVNIVKACNKWKRVSQWSLYAFLNPSKLYNSNLIQFKRAEQISDHEIMPLFFFYELMNVLQDFLLPFTNTLREGKGNKISEDSPVIIPHLPSLEWPPTADFSSLRAFIMTPYPCPVLLWACETTNCTFIPQYKRHWPSTWQSWSPSVSCISDSTLFTITYCLLVLWTTPCSVISMAALNTITVGVVS